MKTHFKDNNVFTQDEWFEVNLGMFLYASENVMEAYLSMIKLSQNNPNMAISNCNKIN